MIRQSKSKRLKTNKSCVKDSLYIEIVFIYDKINLHKIRRRNCYVKENELL